MFSKKDKKMKQELKDLLYKDLCNKLPYGVKVYIEDSNVSLLANDISMIDSNYRVYPEGSTIGYDIDSDGVKPYLFPLSSMTEEQKVEYTRLQDIFLLSSLIPVTGAHELFDWCDKNFLDYRGLIPNGLALDATDLNIY